MRSLDIGIAYELRSDVPPDEGAPTDALEEYDSRETIDALAAVLAGLGHRPRLLGGGRSFLATMLASPPDLVFNNSEGRGSRSREAQVPAVCEMLGVPCTHSDPLTMALTLDKAMTKRVVHAAALATAPYRVAASLEEAAAIDLPFPLFVKPVGEGSSMGVRVTSRVADRAALLRETQRCLDDYRQPVLVETYLPGIEATVAVLGSGNEARALGTMQIAPASGPAEAFVYGLESKRNYQALVRYHAPPASLTAEQIADAEQLALASHRVLGCLDVSRIDLRFDAAGRACFMEANPLPGLNPVTGDIVVLARLLGIDHATLVGRVVAETIRRDPRLH